MIAARAGLALAAIVGVVALVAATFATIIEITVGTTSKLAGADTELSGYDRHSLALVLIAAFALTMTAAGLRGARPALCALAVAGIVVLAIALLGDLPDVHETGQIGRLYEDAHANPRAGYYLETLGGALLLTSGGGLLLLGAPRGRRRPRGARPRRLGGVRA